MKKTIIATSIIVILGAGYTIASWYTGSIIENNIDAKITQITNEINQYKNIPDVNIQYSDYQKGVFSTSFHLTVNSINLENNKTTIFDDMVTIYHGPFPWNEIKSANFSPKMAAFVYKTSKESNEKLWLAADNKPFMTLNSSIDYSENIKLTANNEPINYNDEETGTNLQTTKNTLSISIDNQLNNIVVKGDVNQLTFKNQTNNIEIKNLIFSNKVFKQSDLSYQAEGQFSIEDGIIGNILSNSDSNCLKLNQLAININATEQNKKLTGTISASINSLIFGQQDIGKGEMLANYTFPTNYDLIPDTNDESRVNNWFVKLNKLLWKNQQGNLNASFALNIADNHIALNELDEDNLILAEANMHLPLKPLAYLIAQISTYNKSMPDSNDIESATKSIVLISNILLKNSPIIDFNYDPIDGIENGISVDLYYSKNENQARLKGKTVTTSEFWQALNDNKLPHF